MASKNSPKAKPDTSEQVRLLTQSELESLMQDMKESATWMQEELQRRHKQRKAQPKKK